MLTRLQERRSGCREDGSRTQGTPPRSSVVFLQNPSGKPFARRGYHTSPALQSQMGLMIRADQPLETTPVSGRPYRRFTEFPPPKPVVDRVDVLLRRTAKQVADAVGVIADQRAVSWQH